MKFVFTVTFFWIIYLLIGVTFAFRQKKLQGSTKKHTGNDIIVNYEIYDYDYYLYDYSGDETKYCSKLGDWNKFPISLGRCFNFAQPKSGEKVLDIGCGRGELAYRCAMNSCSVTAIDYSKDAIDLANKTKEALPKNLRKKMQIKRMDFRDLDMAEKYDIIFMADLLEHLTNEQLRELFKKAKQILKKDTGRIIIHTAPNIIWINVIYPLKRIFDWPSTLRKKTNFFYRRDKYKYDPEMHINEQTPRSVRQLLRGFEAKVWCDDGSSNVISQLTKSFAGADIWAIARLK